MPNRIDLFSKVKVQRTITFFLLLLLFLIPAAKADELPLPDLIPSLSEFRVDACISPQKAFERYCNAATVARFQDFGSVLSPASDVEQGWQFFFGTSIGAVVSLSENSVLSVYYNPWGDVALICQWTNGADGILISDAELVSGDFLRKSKLPSELKPLWRRNGKVPPQLAVVIAANDTIMAFLENYKKRPLLGPDNWRKKLPGLKKQKQIENNRKAVGDLFTQSLTSVDIFFNAKPLGPLKKEMEHIRQLLLAGKTADVLVLAAETSQESRSILEEAELDWNRATMVSLATDPKNAFVFMADFANPEYMACFWFKMVDDKGVPLEKPPLLRIDIMGHILSPEEVDTLAKQAGIKR